MKSITIKQVERALQTPAKAWAGRCYEIACAVVRAKLVPGGTPVYGNWTGLIAKGSSFRAHPGRGFCHHGWVLLPDGQVLDPTRWVFEAVKPYIYIGPADHYDEGGDELRDALCAPPPEWNPDEQVFKLPQEVLGSAALEHVEKLLKLEYADEQRPGELCQSQLFWLANAPYKLLQPHARAIYLALEKLNLRAFVPQDNWKRAEREAAGR